MEEINVEKIMEEIRQEIKDKGMLEELLSFSDVSFSGYTIPVLNLQQLQGDMQAANENYFVDPVRPLEGGLKGKIKKIIRKCILFYIRPIVEDQNLYNINMLDCMKQFYAYIRAEETYKQRQDRMMARLLHENEELRKQIEALKKL